MSAVDVEPTAAELDSLPLLVSVDDHVLENPSIWRDRLPANSRDKGPRVQRERVPVPGDSSATTWSDVWHYEDVRFPMMRGFAAIDKSHHDELPFPVTYDDYRPGAFQIGPRLQDMDTDGVEYSLVFPNTFVRFCGQRFLEAKDRELAMLCVRAYNDWVIEEFAGNSNGRVIASAIIPLWDPSAAAEEVRRNADRGCRAVCFSEIPAWLGLPSLHSGEWDVFFAACQETETVISMHIGSSSVITTTSMDAPLMVQIANHYLNASLSLSDWLMSGTLERFDRLRISYAESQAGWIPYIVSRLDDIWARDKPLYWNPRTLSAPPSSFIAGRVFACVFRDATAFSHPDILGIDNICFETDYPHPDSNWPNSRRAAWQQTASLTPDDRDKVLRRNGMILLGIESAEMSTVAVSSHSE